MGAVVTRRFDPDRADESALLEHRLGRDAHREPARTVRPLTAADKAERTALAIGWAFVSDSPIGKDEFCALADGEVR